MGKIEDTPHADLRKARATMRADAREAILSAAAAVLSEGGPSALTVRRVAQAVNASTTVIYTAFGGKDGLFDALYLHSFAGLERAFAAHGEIADPRERLGAMCRAYRHYALSQPSLYNVMFGDLGRAYEAPLESRRRAWKTFRILRDTVEACMPAERDARRAGRVTLLLWAAMHGLVSLDMRGLLGEAEDQRTLFDDAVRSVLAQAGATNRA